MAAVLAMMRQLQVAQLLKDESQRARVLALIAQRVLKPASKLTTVRALRSETAHSTLGIVQSLAARHVTRASRSMPRLWV